MLKDLTFTVRAKSKILDHHRVCSYLFITPKELALLFKLLRENSQLNAATNVKSKAEWVINLLNNAVGKAITHRNNPLLVKTIIGFTPIIIGRLYHCATWDLQIIIQNISCINQGSLDPQNLQNGSLSLYIYI